MIAYNPRDAFREPRKSPGGCTAREEEAEGKWGYGPAGMGCLFTRASPGEVSEITNGGLSVHWQTARSAGVGRATAKRV